MTTAETAGDGFGYITANAISSGVAFSKIKSFDDITSLKSHCKSTFRVLSNEKKTKILWI